MEGQLVIFNVGGTRYETTRATINNHAHTMLAMILAHHDEREIFLDRNGELFRWILLWYRTQVLVDHKQAGVPKEVWDAEVGYFLLDRPGEELLEPPTKKHDTKLDAIINDVLVERDNEHVDRHKKYDEFMEWMLSQRPAEYFEYVSHPYWNDVNVGKCKS